jgi:hypothetical protein
MLYSKPFNFILTFGLMCMADPSQIKLYNNSRNAYGLALRFCIYLFD